MVLRIICVGVVVVIQLSAYSQNIHSQLPRVLDTERIYVFYLHGGIIQTKGADAVSPYYGKYEYTKILKTLGNRDVRVISEVRPPDTKEAEYAEKVVKQIDTLLEVGLPAKNVVIVGASLGAYIAVEVMYRKNHPDIKYALLGLCSQYALDFYQKYTGKLQGNVLSIYELSDSKGSCLSIFEGISGQSRFEEIPLNLGVDHGFLYRPYAEWVDPLFEWIRK